MKAIDYITPTVKEPVYQIINTYTGETITGLRFKDWKIKSEYGTISGITSARDLKEAIVILLDYIRENSDYLSKSSFVIEMINGSVDKHGEPEIVKCYSISMRQAKKYRLI